MKNHPRRRWRQALAASAVALVATISLVSPAAAAPIIPDTAPPGSITVHKRVNPTGVLPESNGLENPTPPGAALAGIEFEIELITDVDLRTTAGWQRAADYAGDPGRIDPAHLGTAVTGTTASNGTFTFGSLAIGAYLVTENLTQTQIDQGITPAKPFVVTVPITHPTDLNTWVYDVHVYPKSYQTTPVKAVEDGPTTTYEVGDFVDWTISAPVPAQPTDLFAFKDALVEHLEISATTAAHIALTIEDVALVATDDYTVAYDAATDNTLIVQLTPAGLVKLNAAAGTGQIALTLTTEVISLPADGRIINTGAVFPNSGYSLSDPGVVTPPVESKFGQIDITKIDATTDAPLEGAEFRVFRSESDAEAYAADPAANAALPLQARQNGAGGLVETFTTGVDGKVSIFGLRASNWENGIELTVPGTYQNYWLLETKAPEGYELLTAPFGPISVLYDSATPTVVPFGRADVENAPKVTLPLTGGTIATWLFTVAGALILCGSALLLIRARKRAAQA